MNQLHAYIYSIVHYTSLFMSNHAYGSDGLYLDEYLARTRDASSASVSLPPLQDEIRIRPLAHPQRVGQ